ncbi:MAG TPA: hemerythrin domain-containing protein [Anaeromyxobacteraceae bacterium]|nr:hemerythrin domain-containing protein [Anaeromyxobacteraceae bacterium]
MILCPQLRRLSVEHARWLTEIERWAPEDPASRAARLLALWDAEILPHCRVEEDVLIPELAQRLSEADATVVFTLGDHVVLRRLARELRASDGQERATVVAELERKLAEHAAFEERTLFPALQEALGCHRLAALAPEITKQGRKHPADGPPATNESSRKGTRS